MILPILTKLHLDVWICRSMEEDLFFLHGSHSGSRERGQESLCPSKIDLLPPAVATF